MTAFYMFRLYFSVFEGSPRNEHAYGHAHESPWTMTVPLCVLAALPIVTGGIFIEQFNGEWFAHRVWSDVLAKPASMEALEHMEHLAHEGHYLVMGLSIGMFAAGVGLSSLFFPPFDPLYGSRSSRRALRWARFIPRSRTSGTSIGSDLDRPPRDPRSRSRAARSTSTSSMASSTSGERSAATS